MWTYNNELYHHGVKGMKWGVRKAAEKAGSFVVDHPAVASYGVAALAFGGKIANDKHIQKTYKPTYKSTYKKNARTKGYATAKRIDKLMYKKGISSRQAGNTLQYGSRGAKRIEKRISKGDTESRAEMKETPYIIGRNIAMSTALTAAMTTGIMASNPSGRRYMKNGAKAAAHIFGRKVGGVYKYARYDRYNKAVQLPNPKKRYVKAKWNTVE